jgi:serine/threonine protein phosphatase 1
MANEEETEMAGRTIAIGDIHGCSAGLAAIIKAIDPQPEDTIVTLGDYVDRGIDSKGVLDQLIELAGRCRLVPILGNHDDMMLHAGDSERDFQSWMSCGGQTALDSYGDTGSLDLIPEAHLRFLAQCISVFETETHFFVHANYKPNFRLEQLDGLTLRWLSLNEEMPQPHWSRKIAVVGHTPQPEILDVGHLICLDTGCGFGGWLTAFDVDHRQCWQVNENGDLRSQ